jgi:hypothetical protein
MLVRSGAGVVNKIAVQSAPAHNYVLGVDFQGDDLWVATAKGLSHGIRVHRAKDKTEASGRVDGHSGRAGTPGAPLAEQTKLISK